MKKIGIIAVSIFLSMVSATAMAQAVQTIHEIKEGETLSQLAKKYGTTVGDIMRFNGMNTDSKLFVGEKVKIPEAGQTVVASTAKTHIVEKGETLYQLSKKYGVTVNQLRDWNNITGNNIQIGQTLKVSEGGEQGALPRTANNDVPEKVDPVATVGGDMDQAAEVTAENTNTQEADQAQTSGKQRDQTVFSESADQSTPAAATASAGSEGAFAVAYKSQANGTELITKGVAGTFQSASGWKDGKFFILMNEVAPGTLVKVQTKGKTIYAKVLWNLGNVKENAGLSYRVSDAAASALGMGTEQTDIIVSYFKSE